MAKKIARKRASRTKNKASGKNSTGSVRKAARTRKTGAHRSNAAFMAPVSPSDKLASVVGAKPIPRTEVTKRLWAYIKKNKLQDQKNKRMIKADATLKSVFGRSSVSAFEVDTIVDKPNSVRSVDSGLHALARLYSKL